MNKEKNIFGVYYIYCENNWKDVVTEQIQTIYNSNILSFTKKLYVVISYKEQEELDFIQKQFNSENIKFYSIKNNLQFEFPALKLIKQICEKYVCNIFYMHTKGTGISEKNMYFYHGSTDIKHLQSCVRDWRHFMEYFLLYKAKENILLLEKYDACGVNLIDTPKKHFSGNFWWSKSSYINKLQNIDTIDTSYRWNAEFWIGTGNGNLYSHYQELSAGYTNNIKCNYND
jgi:hypothetical protein